MTFRCDGPIIPPFAGWRSEGRTMGRGNVRRILVGVAAVALAATGLTACNLPTTPQLVAGDSSTCRLRTDGTVECWGDNAYGQLGDGTTTNSSLPIQVAGLTGVTSLAAGSNHTCARLDDGSARCWGSNGNGQLGDGTTTNSSTQVAVVGLTGDQPHRRVRPEVLPDSVTAPRSAGAGTGPGSSVTAPAPAAARRWWCPGSPGWPASPPGVNIRAPGSMTAPQDAGDPTPMGSSVTAPAPAAARRWRWPG